VTPRPGPLDALAADVLGRCGYRFTLATDEAARDRAYRLRYDAVIEQGWAGEADLPSRLECDAYDARAIHVLCWDGDCAIATGRLVLPPRPLPTEQACGITIEPQGRVADVGRMSVARSHQSHRHGVFLALLARLYVEVQQQGYETACGMMSERARSMMRLLGLQLEVLGEERPHWGELRAPVRFSMTR
jgi:N-acyl-L-homoserine lactone synthetase